MIRPHITDGWQTTTHRYLKLTHRSQFLSRLATEMDVCHSLCLLDMPLENVNLVNSLSADESFENPWLSNNFQDATKRVMSSATSMQSHTSSKNTTKEKEG